ncbi:WD40 repeat-like protein [Rhizopogon salebrosus TDB-379]|nr:WD40 repeat-like protein [Rhizopogon salebrosus TDB-379]
MASTSSTQPATAPKIILTPVLTLAGQDYRMQSISYFPDGKQMISGSTDKTTRRWDLHAGKEIEGVRNVCEWDVSAVVVSKDGRWVVTAGGDEECGELKACEVQTEMVKKFQGHSRKVTCVDISADCVLLASGSEDNTTKIWSMDTGKLVAGPFKSDDLVGAIRFSRDSKKLAINSHMAATTIYEFDASTLGTLGAPFEGHTMVIFGLALSSDDALLVSTSYDNTIKLWAFESRQLLASFPAVRPNIVALSPDSSQLAYTTTRIPGSGDNNIIICNIPPGILSSIGLAQEASVCICCIYLSFI